MMGPPPSHSSVPLGLELGDRALRLARFQVGEPKIWTAGETLSAAQCGVIADRLRTEAPKVAAGWSQAWDVLEPGGRSWIAGAASQAESAQSGGVSGGAAEIIRGTLGVARAVLVPRDGRADPVLALVMCTSTGITDTARVLLRTTVRAAGFDLVEEISRLQALVRQLCTSGAEPGVHLLIDPCASGLGMAVTEVRSGSAVILCEQSSSELSRVSAQSILTERVAERAVRQGLNSTAEAFRAVEQAIRTARAALAGEPEVDLAPRLAAHGVRGPVKLARTDVEACIAPYRTRLESLLDAGIRSSGLQRADVTHIHVSGDTAIRYVADTLMTMFGKAPRAVAGFDAAPALGAAQRCAELSGESQVFPLSQRGKAPAPRAPSTTPRLVESSPALRPNASAGPRPVSAPSGARPAPSSPRTPSATHPAQAPTQRSATPVHAGGARPAPHAPQTKPGAPRPGTEPPLDPREEHDFEEIQSRARKPSPFDVLGVHWSAPESEIHDAYRSLLVRLRPGGRWDEHAHARVEELRACVERAWETLRTPEGRILIRRRDHASTDFESMAGFLRQRANSLHLAGRAAEAEASRRMAEELSLSSQPAAKRN